MFRGRGWHIARLWSAIALAVLGLAFLTWASTSAASYEVCQAERHSSHPGKDNFSQEIAYFAVCEGVAIDANGELLTALATIIMAVFTGTLWLVTGKAVTLARQEFISTHRPRLRVRKLQIEAPEPDQPVVVTYELVNVGDTAAIVSSISLFLRTIPNYSGQTAQEWQGIAPNDANAIQGGEAFFARHVTGFLCRNPVQSFDESLRIVAVIEYADGNGVMRHTAFRRICVRQGERFRYPDPIDPDTEYED